MARIAIYHSNGSAKGPQSLMRFLTGKNGFHCERVTPSEIREGCLSEFDALVMPGGSGSLQSETRSEDEVRFSNSSVAVAVTSDLRVPILPRHITIGHDLINARVWDRSHWARTGGRLLGMTAAGRRVLNTDRTSWMCTTGRGHSGARQRPRLARVSGACSSVRGSVEGAQPGACLVRMPSFDPCLAGAV